MALSLVLSGTAQGDAVINQAVVANLGGLANNDPHAVVNDKAAANPGARVDLNPRPHPAPLAYQPGQKLQAAHIEKVGDAVIYGGVYARVEQKNLQAAPGRRIAGLIGPQGLA